MGRAGSLVVMVVGVGLAGVGLATTDAPPDAASALAETREAGVIAERQETMRQVEAIWMMLDDMINRLEPPPEEPTAREEAVRGAHILADLLAAMRLQYPQGSFAPPSEALPMVRDDWQAFTSLTDQAEQHAHAVATALEAEDRTGADRALDALGDTCTTCHLRFSPGIRSDHRLPAELR